MTDQQGEATIVTEDASEGRGIHWGRWAVLVGVLVAAAAYVGLAYYAADRVPAGATVLGVDIGGMTRDEAIEAVQAPIAEVNATPVELTSEDRVAMLDPAGAGLTADAEATVDPLVGFTLNPYELLRRLTGSGVVVEPVTVVDLDALTAEITATTEPLGVEPQDATVTIARTGASTTPAVDGVAVDVEDTAAGLALAWPVDTYEVTTEARPAQISTADAQRMVAQLNSEILAGDVAMTGENGPATVTSDQLVRFGSVEAVDGALVYVIDGKNLAAELEALDPGLVSDARPASFSFNASHQLKTVKSEPGRAIDGEALGPVVVEAASSAQRAGELPYKNTKAKVTSNDLGVSDFKTIVASFDTPLTDEYIRTQNLIRGAEKVTGVVVKPDEVFSLIDALSPITAAGGYYPAHIIVNGYITDGIGGGLSQMATTAYNAAYFAGLEDVEHRPHTKYFTRYPAGREATIYVGALDMRFRNNTPYALVMSSYVEAGRLHVEIWSTKHFTVKTRASDRTNVTPATMTESDHEGCIDTPVGEPGFTITNWREVYLKDDLVDESSYTWTYLPNDGVRCV